MLKERFTYKDWNGQDVTEDFYFNITEVELGENLHVKEDFERWLEQVDHEGPERDLTIPEVQELLRLVKFTLKLAYGVRADEGRRFVKTEQVWEEFTQGAAYSPFLMSLFQIEPDTGLPKANRWMAQIMPAELRAELDKQPALQQRPPTRDHQQKQQRPVEVVRVAEEQAQPVETPQVITQADLVKMTPEDFQNWQRAQLEQ